MQSPADHPDPITTVRALMALWPSDADFARDIGIKPSHAQVMKVRGSLPVDYWPATIEAAAKRHIDGVTAETLMRLHASDDGNADHAHSESEVASS